MGLEVCKCLKDSPKIVERRRNRTTSRVEAVAVGCEPGGDLVPLIRPPKYMKYHTQLGLVSGAESCFVENSQEPKALVDVR
jgi:hypothetical protein